MLFVPGSKHANVILKVEHFTMEACRDGPTYGASLRWPFKELQVLVLCWLKSFPAVENKSTVFSCLLTPHVFRYFKS